MTDSTAHGMSTRSVRRRTPRPRRRRPQPALQPLDVRVRLHAGLPDAVEGVKPANLYSTPAVKVLYIVLGIGMKTLSDYTSHLAHTPSTRRGTTSCGHPVTTAADASHGRPLPRKKT